MKNPSDFPGSPPYKAGDLVIYSQIDTPTLKYGDRVEITHITWNRTKRKWLIKINHQDSLYSVESFAPWEPVILFVALDISDNPRLNPGKINLDLILHVDTSFTTVKEYVKDEVRRDPTLKLGIFSLTYITEMGD